MSRARYNFHPRLPLALVPAIAAMIAIAIPHATQAATRSVYLLTTTNAIAVLPIAPSSALPAPTQVTGVTAGDVLVALDVRPQNGRLYGLGFNSGVGTLTLYHIVVDALGTRAVPVGPSGTFVNAGTTPVPITGTAFGMDFNPAVDRLRVNTNSGQNFRMNPNTGSFIDGDFGGAAGSVAGLNMDGAINGGTTTADDVAYSNNIINTNITTLYTLDSTTNALFIQNPPNAGTQTMSTTITLNGSTLDFSNEGGLDIPIEVNAPTSSAPANGSAYAALSVAGISGIYRINLINGIATLISTLGITVRDIAVTSETATAVALTSTGTMLVRFLVQNPNAVSVVAITGITAGETLVGFDSRPMNGQLMGLGINTVANNATMYLIDAQSGGASVIGTPSSIAFTDGGGTPVDFVDGSWGFDFNPQVDRVRVIAANGINFRVNPNNGAAVDGDLGGAAGSVAGVNTDGPINGLVGAAITAAAYANNAPATTFTTLYTLDAAGNRLSIQSPPNAGTQMSPRQVTLNGLQFNFDTVAGFDIPPGVNAASANADAIGEGYAVLGAGPNALYSIDLPTGALQLIGNVGNGLVPLEGLSVWNRLATPLFSDGFE